MKWEDVKPLIDVGLSYDKIALKLGEGTRSTVSGVVSRERARRVRAGETPMPLLSGGVPRTPATVRRKEIKPEPPPLSELPHDHKRVSLLELEKNMCHWPLGDPAARDFGYCGLPGAPYCSLHAVKRVQPGGPKKVNAWVPWQ